MKMIFSKRFMRICLIVFIIVIIGAIVCISPNEKREPVVLCGLTEQDEQADVAFNYVSKKTFISPDGYMAIQTPNGWRSQSVNHDGLTTEVLCSNDGTSHIQLCSFKLINDNAISPDSIIERLEFENMPGGKVSYSIVSENPETLNRIHGKTIEIMGADVNEQKMQGLVTVLVGQQRCYILSCITSEQYFSQVKDTFTEVEQSLILQ